MALSTKPSFNTPEELGRIIQAFAKPAFVHWRLFKDAKQVVPKRHWTDLEQALSVRDADNVCRALTDYMNAYRVQELATNALTDYKESIGDFGSYWCTETYTIVQPDLTPEQSDTRDRLWDTVSIARSNEFKTYRALLVEIHGEPTVAYAEYLDKRRARFGWNDYGHPLTLREWWDDEVNRSDDEDEDE
jgi:hypothetical protein